MIAIHPLSQTSDTDEIVCYLLSGVNTYSSLYLFYKDVIFCILRNTYECTCVCVPLYLYFLLMCCCMCMYVCVYVHSHMCMHACSTVGILSYLSTPLYKILLTCVHHTTLELIALTTEWSMLMFVRPTSRY